jgi:hypothetical protein
MNAHCHFCVWQTDPQPSGAGRGAGGAPRTAAGQPSPTSFLHPPLPGPHASPSFASPAYFLDRCVLARSWTSPACSTGCTWMCCASSTSNNKTWSASCHTASELAHHFLGAPTLHPPRNRPRPHHRPLHPLIRVGLYWRGRFQFTRSGQHGFGVG